MPQATQHGDAYEPRHSRRQEPVEAEVDPFLMPDPVVEKLREWKNGQTGQGERDASQDAVAQQSPAQTAADAASQHSGHPSPRRIDPTVSPPVEGAGVPRSDTADATTMKVPGGQAPDVLGEPRAGAASSAGDVKGVGMVDDSGDGKEQLVEPLETSLEQVGARYSGSSDLSDHAEHWSSEHTIGSGQVPAPPAIVASNLRKTFRDTVAVEDVSFTVPAGSIVAILGPNGAGKTTTVNMLCTLLRPDGGSATVCGNDVVNDAAAVRRSIMLTGQFAALDESLTGRENLVLFGRLLGLSKTAARGRADELLDLFSLTDAGSKKVGKYSGGMRRRIDIACGLVTSPQVVFLDEPTTGLDPRSRQEVWTLVESLRESGVTILLTTQYLEEADTLSDNIIVIDKGRVIAQGTSDELKESIGPAYCELTPAHLTDVTKLRDLLEDFRPTEPTSSADEHVVSVPAPRGPETLVEVIARTATAGIQLSDVAMRRPSLDEVFLALTDPRRDRRPTP